MTKEVMVTIAGLQMADESDADQELLEMVHVGEYYKKNGIHYILFDEVMEGMAEPVRNIIKVKDRGLEIRKRGPVAVHMVFEEGSSRQSIYQVPYGSFQVETSTTSVRVAEDEQGLEVLITYQLAVNGRHCADCDIRVFVQSREQFCLD